MSKNNFLIFSSIFLFTSSLFSCAPKKDIDVNPPVINPPIEEKEKTKVHIVSLPNGANEFKDGELFIGEEKVPLYNVKVNDDHNFVFPDPSRIDNGVARVYIKGRVDFTYKVNYAIKANTKILPSAYNVVPTHDLEKQEIKFQIYSAGKYVIEPNGDPKNALHLFVYNFDDYKKEESLDGYKVIEFKEGIFTKDNSEYINDNNRIILDDNTIVYIHDEAVVHAALEATNKKNIKIIGRGILTGENFDRKNTIVPVNFAKCSNIEVRDINIFDPAARTCNFYFVEDSEIKDISIISSRANGDGVTLQSCKNIDVEGAFIRGFDDNLVVKNYSYPYGNKDRETHGTTENINFRNCFLWADLAQSMEIGYETTGKYIKNVTFDNILVLHAFHKPIISIHNSNYADVYDITFKNITVEDYSCGLGDAQGNSELIDFKSKYSQTFSNNPAGGSTEVGNIYNVSISNVLVKSKRNGLIPKFNFEGQKDFRSEYKDIISEVKDIYLSDIQLMNEKIQDASKYINRNTYTKNIAYKSTQNSVTGCELLRSHDKETLDKLDPEIEFV